MLGARSEVQGMLVQGLVVQDVPAVDPVTGFKSAGKHTGSQSVMGLVGAGLKEAQSVLQLVAKTYRLVIMTQMKLIIIRESLKTGIYFSADCRPASEETRQIGGRSPRENALHPR